MIPLHYFLGVVTQGGKVIERGWMLAESANELIEWARVMGYGIDLTYLGEADMGAFMPALKGN